MRATRNRLAQPTNPKSLSARARAKRWDELLRRFPDLGSMRVLDLGGTPTFWRAAPVRPTHVTVVNLDSSLRAVEDWMHVRIGDACEPVPEEHRYDLAISNSLLEHVGPAARRRAFANRIRASADRYWVQTPNRYFPIEPHWLFPGFQFLPFAARVSVTRSWTGGHRHSRDPHRAAELVREIELIGPGEMRALFPDAELWIERFLGLPKSLVAVRA
jgi:hypothetical protein